MFYFNHKLLPHNILDTHHAFQIYPFCFSINCRQSLPYTIWLCENEAIPIWLCETTYTKLKLYLKQWGIQNNCHESKCTIPFSNTTDLPHDFAHTIVNIPVLCVFSYDWACRPPGNVLSEINKIIIIKIINKSNVSSSIHMRWWFSWSFTGL